MVQVAELRVRVLNLPLERTDGVCGAGCNDLERNEEGRGTIEGLERLNAEAARRILGAHTYV